MKCILNWFKIHFCSSLEPIYDHVKMRHSIPIKYDRCRYNYITTEEQAALRDKVLKYDFSEFKTGAYCCIRCRMIQHKNMKYKHSREECNFKLVELITNS